MVLALGVLFAACNEAQEVTGAVEVTAPKISAVSGVEVVLTSTGGYAILKWRAVQDAGDYNMYYHEEGKVTIGSFYSSDSHAQNRYIYALYDGEAIDNNDVDNWSARVFIGGYSSLFAGKKVQIGIQSVPMFAGLASSDIVWSEYMSF
jgi:hypothetical protein